MNIKFHKNFDRSYKKLPIKTKEQFKKRIELFLSNPLSYQLNNHPLIGNFDRYRSINITGDIRAIYKEIDKDNFIFVEIGSHSQLYG